MLRRDGNAEKFWSVARRCTTRNQLEAVSNIRWRTGSPFVALFGPVYLVPCRTFSALKMFDTFLEDSQHRGRFAASDAKHCCHSTGVMEKHCEIHQTCYWECLMQNAAFLGRKRIKPWCLSTSKPRSGSENSFKSDSFTAQCGKAAKCNFSCGFLVLSKPTAFFFRLARRHGFRRFRHNRFLHNTPALRAGKWISSHSPFREPCTTQTVRINPPLCWAILNRRMRTKCMFTLTPWWHAFSRTYA